MKTTMSANELLKLKGFYKNELINQILAFWMPRCEDKEYGGFVNCFDNEGKKLMGYDKYTWSQGRFVWMFAKLAATEVPMFSQKERGEFLRLAKSGRDFLMKHCLMDTDDMRCVFLMERDGRHKYVGDYKTLDMSIYADCFAVLGMVGYAAATGDEETYLWGKRLYDSIVARVRSGKFHTLPYPLSENYRAHGIPMILSNVTKELIDASRKIAPADCDELKELLDGFTSDILEHFVDENNTVHEIIHSDNTWVDGLIGQHANPGHTIEDMWFMIDAADILDKPEMVTKAAKIAARAFEIGWDDEMGGVLHYADVHGGVPKDLTLSTDEPMERQVLEGYGDKLWWVHSEALYTTLLCHFRTGDKAFLDWHEKVFDYTFKTFPNTDPEIREWKQICKRDGSPQDKVVALPVKDPFHITRNLLLILELLEKVSFS